ncbi:hypothetical protein AA0488_0705 [Kozakia baliensis NRIC 0488]|uniref:Uncharacterized protein n=2 Tax=Kozakia baliensis TaxID=153496 RepID=A0A1D8UTD7_9PROT|nr:hypothetical protein [Kozakia baliensis]AOX16905.1 hypothetical protein A0U89_06900 [Kozakia baliensis]GBR25648.1 hypothetical protein AA0488_0705 [Kozakia baliensis NRIC 0488]GEL64048.1 hypothetical protein KBA01_13340 [Kozakia baliensis]
MPTVTATNSQAITDLVQSGEALYGTIAGRALSENGQKISNGITSLFDGLFPQAQQKVSFDIEGVFTGATKTLEGIDEAIVAAKTKVAAATSSTTPETPAPSSTATEATPVSGGGGSGSATTGA